MDVDINPFTCFCSGGSETPAAKLAQATAKGYRTLLSYVEAIGDAAILERLKEAQNVGRLRYHMECKRDLYNNFMKDRQRSIRAVDTEKESAQ